MNLEYDNSLIICPIEEKNKLLSLLDSDSRLYNIKFMTLQEFKDNYFFSYDENTIYYLMKKYGYDIDVISVYLNSMYVVDVDTEYDDEKLSFIKKLKIELINGGLLYFNHTFKKYLNTKKVIVKNYYDLDLYEELALNYKVSYCNVNFSHDVFECNTLEQEVNNVCLEIIKLLNSGIDINKISLVNISDEYLYTIKKMFSYYDIPINIDMRYSIYGTGVVDEYLKLGVMDLEDMTKNSINKKLLSVISSLSFLDTSSREYKKILINKLKNTYLPVEKLKNAVSIKNLYNEEFLDDEYVFVLGFNQESLPKLSKDINYLGNNLSGIIDIYSINYLNLRRKKVTIDLLSRIKNLYLSYKLESPFSNFYPSSLIDDYNLSVIYPEHDNFCFSDIYNKIRLAEMLDQHRLYGSVNDKLNLLYGNYDIPYCTYSNTFTGISNDRYLKNLDYPLKLSYTSLNTYRECKFKYYINNVLKISTYEDSFSAYIGSLFHKILSLCFFDNFDFEVEYQKYLEKRELNLKEKVLLLRIREELISLIDNLKKQQLITGYNDYFFEKKLDIDISCDVSVVFTGTIDKIMYYQNVEDIYFSIIDYKTGTIDINIEPMKYGLHMQLPVYLYLINCSRAFTSPIFTGSYYQNILFNYPTWSVDLEKEKKNQLLLKGYSTDRVDLLERFDSTYTNSELIKSMTYSDEKGFGRYSKVISDDMLYDLVKYTEKHIVDTRDEILSGDFSINPKFYNGKNISCEFCSFKDLCYMKEKDIEYLEKVENLDFLNE